MKSPAFPFIFVVFLCSVVCSWTPRPAAAQTPVTQATPATARSPTSTPSPPGKTIVVNSASDSGPGSLREAIGSASPGDSITFDPSVFPPTSPDTITLASPLPELRQGNLTIDASDVGVILDGSEISMPELVHGLSISSDNNVIRGLQIMGFSDAGIALSNGARDNTIGGDRDIGAGPLGQGNLVSGDGNHGIGLWDEGTSFNIIQGNLIGTDASGTIVRGGLRDGIHSNGASHNLVVDNLIGGYESGVYVCCVSDGHNVFRGNYIGTNADGTADIGNRGAGIVVDRSGFNVVGPANVIAHNGGPGIGLYTSASIGNRITRNRIHDNGGRGIELSGGGNTGLAAPILFEFDLNAGTVSGWACADCIVEIFSDSADEGAVYEGQTTADSAGNFAFSKEAPFTGPRLTATATDTDGNTSQFSVPTPQDTPRRIVILQEGNDLPKARFQTKQSRDLADNRIGGVAEARHVDEMVWGAGVKWMRVIVDPFGEWQHVDWGTDEYTIDPEEEKIIDDLVNNAVKIMLVLDVWHNDHRTVFHKSEEDIAIYLSWVRFMVRHFKGRIEYYEILNEPDLNFEAPSGMPVDAYVNLIERTVPVIREEDPEAKIVVGAVPDTRFDHVREWMWGVLNSEAMPLVDGFSWHPMYGAAPSDDPRGVRDPGSPQMDNYWENYPSLVHEIKSVADSNGFQGEYLVEEMLWRTPLEPHQSEPDGFTDVSGAKYYARAILIHLGLDVTTGVALVSEDSRPRSHSVIQGLCTVMAGAAAADLPVVIESEATNIKHYGFVLPNGDQLLALWTDGAAVEEDPGVTTTLILPGLSDQTVTGIDVLNGFQQEMITEVENGNLVIRDLVVKDYPVILSSSASVVGIATDGSPFTFALFQNYPNPFNSQTTMTYELKENAQVSFKIYNILGQLVRTLVDEKQVEGRHSIQWNGKDQKGRDLASGLYFYKLETADFVKVRKMLLIR